MVEILRYRLGENYINITENCVKKIHGRGGFIKPFLKFQNVFLKSGGYLAGVLY